MLRLFPLLLLLALFSHSTSFGQSPCDGAAQWLPVALDSGVTTHIFEHNGELHKAGRYGSQRHISRWDGNQWQMLTSWTGALDHAAYVSWNGLIVTGGIFANIGGVPNTTALAAWDGNSWVALGAFTWITTQPTVTDLAVWNGNLLVGGTWDEVDGIPCTGIAMYDGTQWSNMNANFTPSFASPNPHVVDFVEYQGNLVVGGSIENSGGTPVNHLAVWDGTNWSAMGSGTDREVKGLAVIGNDLFVYSPQSQDWGGQSYNTIARWDGTQYNDMGFMSSTVSINDMVVHNGELYLTLNSSQSATFSLGYTVGNVIKWNGATNWQNLGVIESNPVDMIVFDNQLHVGGYIDATCNEIITGITRLCSDDECGWVEGQVFNDVDFDCDTTGNDGLQGRIVNFQPGNKSTSTNALGEYRIHLLAGNYNATSTVPNHYNQFCPPSGIQAVSVTPGDTAPAIDFGWTPDANVQDLRITMVSSPARPGFDMYYDVIFENVGTIPMNGTVTVDLDTMVDYLQSSVTPDAINGQSLSWNFNNLELFEQRTIRVEANVHPFVSLLGDTMHTVAIIDPIATDALPADNTWNQDQIITGAYDPNDKRVVPGWGNFGEVELGTEELTYTIRFQNTGTDTAFFIRITDVLPEELDPTSLDMLGASHPYSVEIEDRLVTWSFDNILLPDSGTNQLESNGYVTFKIKTDGNQPDGTQISNNAAIYFDFNPPIITNDCYTTWTFFVGVEEQTTMNDLHLYPNPSDGAVTVDFGQYLTEVSLSVYDLSSRQVRHIEGINGSSYRLQLFDQKGTYILRLLAPGQLPRTARILLQ